MGVDFDSILDDVGVGLYQYVMYFLICIPASIPSAWSAFNQVFVAASVDHWCHVPELSHLNATRQKTYIMPKTENDEYELGFSNCYQFDINYTAFVRGNCSFNETFGDGPMNITKCKHGWEYDRSTYLSTIITDFNLVCDDEYWPRVSTTLFYVGSFVGNILFGYIADRWGRRLSFFAILALQVIIGTANAFAPNIYAFIVLRCIIGLCFPALYQIPFIIGMELMGPSSRIFAGMTICVVFGSAMGLLAILASIIRKWSLLTLLCNAPFVVLFSYWWFLPESPRWLVSDGQHDKATKILLTIAKWNKRTVDAEAIREKCKLIKAAQQTNEEQTNARRVNILHLFKTPNVRKMTLLITYIWLVNAIVYNGLTLNITNLGVDDYIVFGVNGLVEIPAYFIAWPLLDRVGRRLPLCISMLIGGAACICTMLVPFDRQWIISALAFIGKFGIAASFAIIYIFAGELYPTVLRGLGMGMSSMVAGIGLPLAPHLIYLGTYFRILPLLIMGGLTVSAGVLSLFLPETVGLPLPQTISDSEHFGQNEKLCFCPTRSRRAATQRPANTRLNHAATDTSKGEGVELLNTANGDTQVV